MSKKKIIVVCWMDEGGGMTVNTLAYHNGKGAIRTYPKDEYDPRAHWAQGVELPFFDNNPEALSWMAQNRRSRDVSQATSGRAWACQLHLPAAKKLLKGSEFAAPEAFVREVV